jgi:hypothetical protein
MAWTKTPSWERAVQGNHAWVDAALERRSGCFLVGRRYRLTPAATPRPRSRGRESVAVGSGGAGAGLPPTDVGGYVVGGGGRRWAR